jgi:CO dehydrogenase/acetyl-CoA synthase gamma subunit (corrinoid Fe-S protein)
VVRFRLNIFRLRQKSLARAMLLSLGAFAASLRMAGFPKIDDLHGSHWQILALLVAAWGMAETARCLKRKWSLYHAGVLILLYADLMVLAGIVVLMAVP